MKPSGRRQRGATSWFSAPERGWRLEAHLCRQLLHGYWIAALSIGALLWLLDMLQRLERLDGGGELPTAAWLALLTIPEQLVELLPVITVLATASILAMLQANREIVVIRMAGWVPWRIAGVALIPMALAVLLALAFSQWGTPLLYHGSGPLLGDSLGDDGIWHSVHGLWMWHGSELLNIGELRFGHVPADINILRFDDSGRIVEHLHADVAALESARLWRLETVRIWSFAPGANHLEILAEKRWQSFLSGSQLSMFQRAPATLALSDLVLYVLEMRRSGQPATSYELALWERLSLPVACLGMALVATATAAAPDSARGSGTGWKMALAVGVGLLYLMLAQLLTYAGLQAALPPAITALMAPTLLVLAGILMMNRAK